MCNTAVSLVRAQSSSACLLRALGLTSILDRRIGIETSAVDVAFGFDAAIGPLLSLSAPQPEHPAPAASVRLPLAHQGKEKAAATCCPILADDELGCEERKLRLGAVAIPIDTENRVLLTRRPSSMRTFPGCWVLPGGSVDPTDESIAHAALRELQEETGLRAPPDACKPLCLWESCYPVTFEEWREARQRGGRVAHFLVAFVAVRVDAAASEALLRLEPNECDCACWVPIGDLATVLSDVASSRGTTAEYARARTVGSDQQQQAEQQQQEKKEALQSAETVAADLLRGVYPNECGEGIGRGHLFALRHLSREMEGGASRTIQE